MIHNRKGVHMKMTLLAVAIRYAYRKTGLALGALALTVDKIDAVPEAQRTLYVEKDGKFHLDVSGLEDTAGLKTSLTTERKARADAEKARKALEDQYAGIDVARYRETLSKFQDNEEAALIAAGKVDEVITRRTEKQRKEFEKQIKAAEDGKAGAMEALGKYMDRVLADNVRQSATKAGMHASAIDDAILRAKSIFSVDDEGNAVQYEEDGETAVLGKDGKSAYSVTEWMDTMKETAPHWFPVANKGGGSNGSGKNTGNAKQMKRAQYDGMSPAEQRNFVTVDKGVVVD